VGRGWGERNLQSPESPKKRALQRGAARKLALVAPRLSTGEALPHIHWLLVSPPSACFPEGVEGNPLDVSRV
jgi:hypothetical protein